MLRNWISHNATGNESGFLRIVRRKRKLPYTYSLAEAAMKVVQDRRSIREYTAEPVSDHDLDIERGKGARFLQGDGTPIPIKKRRRG
jgi:hypothetical protein